MVGILEQDTDSGHRTRGKVAIYGRRPLHREYAGHERSDLDVITRQQVEETFEITPLRPAHIASRVIDAIELVSVAVPAWTVRSREADVEFLVVIGVPRQSKPGLADIDDARATARQRSRRLYRTIGRPARRPHA